MSYSIEDDQNGTTLREGLTQSEAPRVAQQVADARGRPVYLYDDESDESDENRVDPTDPTDDVIRQLQQEAATHGDSGMVATCERALYAKGFQRSYARWGVTRAITQASA